MMFLSTIASQVILTILAVITIVNIYRTPERDRVTQFKKYNPTIRTVVLWIGVALFAILMLNNNFMTSVLAIQIGIVFSWFANLILPFAVYEHQFAKGNQTFNLVIFIINMLLNAVFISIMAPSFYTVHDFNTSMDIFAAISITTISILTLNVIAHLIVFTISKITEKMSGKSFKPNKAYSKDKMADYHEAGLSNDDVNYFRDQMAPAREMIFELDETINETAKLRAINLRHKTVITCQDYFRSIVEEPNRIGEAGNFLYKLLPNLTDLVDKYNEINGHVAKNKQTYLILDKSAQMIELIAEEINEDYIKFHQATYNAMDEEIAFAERILNGKNGTSDNVDDIIKEDIGQSNVDDMMQDLDDFLNNHK